MKITSLSARRAWIEIRVVHLLTEYNTVALRKESVDRNVDTALYDVQSGKSLSARRAWIEILVYHSFQSDCMSLSARRAWIEIPLSA